MSAKLFSYPATSPGFADAKTRLIKSTIDNLQLVLEQGSRTINTGQYLWISDYEYAQLSASIISSGKVVDAGRISTPQADDHLRYVEIPLTLSAIANGTIASFQLPVAGSVSAMRFIVLDPATTGSKATTLSLKLATAPVGTSEKVTLTEGGSGLTSFTLTFGAQTTGSLVAAATAAQVQTALQALSTIGAGNCTVTGNAGGPYTVTFTGTLAGTDTGAITTTPTGGTGTVTATVPTTGALTTVALTSANCTPEGAIVASSGTLTAADNVFTASTVLNVIAASTTAFVEGRGILQVGITAS